MRAHNIGSMLDGYCAIINTCHRFLLSLISRFSLWLRLNKHNPIIWITIVNFFIVSAQLEAVPERYGLSEKQYHTEWLYTRYTLRAVVSTIALLLTIPKWHSFVSLLLSCLFLLPGGIRAWLCTVSPVEKTTRSTSTVLDNWFRYISIA